MPKEYTVQELIAIHRRDAAVFRDGGYRESLVQFKSDENRLQALRDLDDMAAEHEATAAALSASAVVGSLVDGARADKAIDCAVRALTELALEHFPAHNVSPEDALRGIESRISRDGHSDDLQAVAGFLRGVFLGLPDSPGDDSAGYIYPAGPGAASDADAANPKPTEPGIYIARGPSALSAIYLVKCSEVDGELQWSSVAHGYIIDEPAKKVGPISLAGLEG